MGVVTDFVRQVASILPEVEKPKIKPSLTNRLLWTAVAVATYLIMAQIPLYGVASGAQDQMSYTAIIFASSQGTLMTLGIGPIVTAGLILQLLKGAEIIKEVILNGIPVEHWRIRIASSVDCKLYWHLVNDPDVRQSAFDSRTISWKNHQKWFHNKLNDSSSTLLLIESHLGTIGQVRFENSGRYFKIDFSIARQFRGMGLGERLLSEGIESFLENNQGSTLVSEVKEGNQASMKIFQNLGFREISHSPQLKKKTRRFQLQLSEITR